ncbi:MAG: FAD-dependent oxidoreductase, partial [Methylophilus sp.]
MSNSSYDLVIVGGGSAGSALAASVKKRAPSLTIAIIEPSDKHYYQPAWTLVGAGEFDVNKTVRPMAEAIPAGVTWLQAAVTEFQPVEKKVLTDNLGTIEYTQLVVAAGLKLNWEGIKGLTETLGKNGVTSNYRVDLAPYTWQLVQQLQSGEAIFTQPPMPIKCAGAPQKALYLSCAEWLGKGQLDNIKTSFYSSTPALFGVKEYVEPLMQYIRRYKVNLNLNSTLVEVDGPGKTAWFNVKDADGNVKRISKPFDLLHVVPPQTALDFLKQSPLANADGWVEVDQHSLQHVRYPEVFGVGDCTSTPNAKTAAAARKQVV